VRNDAGDVIAAIGIAGPAHRMARKVLLSYARDLMAATDAVSRRLGYPSIPLQKRA
jgi:DNA-binding IclR family transcriptional regulator